MMNSQPDRAKENSPPIHRWVSGRTQSESRQGRKNTIASADVLFRPHGAWGIFFDRQPNDQSLGYFRMSLRDKVVPASRRLVQASCLG